MPIFRISRELVFPDPELAEESGLLGVGGDLSADRLVLGYRNGIFPWYSAGQPILWWSPDPRMVLETADLVIQRSLAKRIRQRPYEITLDRAFPDVIRRCARVPRPGQNGTWLTPEMIRAFEGLHERGIAHSCEAWAGGKLVGGLYGVAVGRFFSGESMFADAPDASKIGFVAWARQLQRWGFPLIDCQVHTEHLARFGAIEIARADYLSRLPELANAEGRSGRWSLDDDLSGQAQPS
jgi:leucyl/phenylalanyl-tRNA--protein transferase